MNLIMFLIFHISWFKMIFFVPATTSIVVCYCLLLLLLYISWTWGWMEPPLGTISFVLLALQFARAQLENLGYKPYTSFVKTWRGKRLASQFPQYNAKVLINFSKSSALYVQR